MRLRKYWDTVRKAQLVPDYSHFNFGTIGDLRPYCFTVTIDSGGEQAADGEHSLKYIYMGEMLIKMYGHDLTGKTLTQGVKHFMGAHIFDKIQEAVKTGQPIEDTGHIVNQQGKMVKYRACYLPFGKEQGSITHIIGGLTYRAF